MSHNAILHGGPGTGGWVGYVPTVLDFQMIDMLLAKSLNADDGGAWAPSTPIELGGSGLTVTTAFIASGTNTLSGVTTLGTTHVHGQSFVWNKMTIDGANSGESYYTSGALLTGLAGSVLDWSGTAEFNDTVLFNDNVDFEANLTHNTGIAAFSSTLNIGGTTQIVAGSFGIQGGVSTSFASPLVLASGGGVLYRLLIGPDADTTINANVYDFVRVGTLGANRTYVLKDAPNGTVIFVTMASSASGSNQCRVYDDHSIQLQVLLTATSGQPYKAWFIVRSGGWEVLDFEVYP